MFWNAASRTQSDRTEAPGMQLRPPCAALSSPLSVPLVTGICVTGLVALIAAIDFSVPAEVDAPILFGLCVGFSVWSRSPWFVWLVAVTSVILTYAGVAFGPATIASNSDILFAWINRTFVGAELLVLAACVHLWIRRARQRRALEEKNGALRENLHRSQMMAEVGQLTEGIAHDFRNILTIIIGSLRLIVKSRDEARRRELARAALEAAESATGLVQRLLLFFRPEPFPSRAVHIDAMIRRMLPQWQRTLGEPIELIVHLLPDLWPCQLNPAQLEAAILSLAVNAKDAMPEGGRLAIRAENSTIEPGVLPELASGDYVMVSVSDNGPGIAADALPRVFEPFFTTKGPSKGSGLGLWMVRSFANQFGGTVRLDSTVGEGTTVRLYLPRVPQSPMQGAGRRSPFENRRSERG